VCADECEEGEVMKETIFIGKDRHDIEVKPITLVVKGGEVDDIDAPARFMIEPEHTLHHAGKVKQLHPRTQELVNIVFPGGEVASRGYLHVVGLIDLTLKLTEKGVQVGWRYPETYLYPKEQCQLADVLVKLTKGGE
jgi:hypothetical protein